MTRKFSVHGEIFTPYEYGKFTIEKQHIESYGATRNPSLCSHDEFEVVGLETLLERVHEDELVFEIKSK